MKRVLAAALALLLTAFALAETGPFSFRNGVQWGMTQREVLLAEDGPDYTEGRENAMDAVTLNNAVNEGAACDITYLFYQGALSMIRVLYDGKECEGLLDALSQRYGEATEIDTSLLSSLLLDDEAMPERFYGWLVGEDTLVCLLESRSDNIIQIVYADLREPDGTDEDKEE